MLTSPIHAKWKNQHAKWQIHHDIHDILTICSKVKSSPMMQGVGLSFLRLSQVWDLSRPLEHTGDTAGIVGTTDPQGMPNYATSIGFIALLTATAPVPENNLNILGERSTKPSYLLGNRKHLGLELSSFA